MLKHQFVSQCVGDEFEVTVATCGRDPRTTLVVTDADGLFGLAVDTIRLMQIPGLVPPMTVVGVGYPDATSILDTVERRVRDLTPTAMTAFPGSGGGEAFADFLGEELRPWVDHVHAPPADELTYFGHSLGGLFGTHVLLTRPSLFDRYIISSPSLWWDNELMLAIETAEASTRPEPAGQVVFGIGALETDSGRRLEARRLPHGAPFKPPPAHLDMVEDLRRFVDQLRSRNHPDLDVHSITLEDEFHATVPGIVLSRALRWFYRD